MAIELKISEPNLMTLHKHLFPGDGKEGVAFILCGQHFDKDRVIILAHKVVPIPYDRCEIRERDTVKWKTETLPTILDEALKKGLSVVKVHSHPEGYESFSELDDESDEQLFPSIYSWLDNARPNLSAILLPGNKLIVRHVKDDGTFESVNKVSVITNELNIYYSQMSSTVSRDEFEIRNVQVFGQKTRNVLRSLKVGVVGASGTGSPVIEQLSRLGIGHLVLVDPDIIEEKNLNRITNAKRKDALNKRFKVDVLRDAVFDMGLGTKVDAYALSLFKPAVIKSLATCDFIFGCVDSAEARCLLNRLCNFYLVPMIDIGIALVADGSGGVTNICGKIGYFQPGKSDHLSRRSVLPHTLEAESLLRASPELYKERVKDGYIKGVRENSPAIIPVNTYASSKAVLEFLARVHEFRSDPNERFAEQQFCLVNSWEQFKSESDFPESSGISSTLGLGDVYPLLGMPEFGVVEEACDVQVAI